jgi:hypothetical protein
MTSQPQEDASASRDLVFISKATPGDDDFALWLAPRLEAAGYKVFADILCLKYGDRWRQVLTKTLHERAVKMLLCCRDSTLTRNGVQEEIGIAEDLTKQLGDPRFIIPMKLERYKKVFGIGELQRVDFEPSWADGLNDLLVFLDEEGVPRSANGEVNPEWASFRTRRSISIRHEPEPLVSNWLRVSSLPDTIKYYVPTGAISIGAVSARCKDSKYPAHYHNRGILTFMNFDEVSELFADVASLKLESEANTLEFDSGGMPAIDLVSRDAHNILMSMLREAWHTLCREKQLVEYPYAALTGFHVGEAQVDIGKRVPWGRQGDRRSAMLRNVAKGKVWHFGVSAIPAFWPYPHFRFKTRVLFSELIGEKQAGDVIDNTDHQFRLRRTVCKGWRNKQWYGRFLAFLEILSGDSAFITLNLSPTEQLKIVAEPITFTSPVTTALPDSADDDDEETDESVLAGRDLPPEDIDGEGDSGPS